MLFECDTTWTIYGYMPDFLSADHLSGSGDSYIVFRTLLENPGNNERMNAFTIVSGRGDLTELHSNSAWTVFRHFRQS